MEALFIYYKVDAGHAPAVEQAVRQMQAALVQAHEGLTARLWRRSEGQAPQQQTWMETYEHPRGVSPALASRIDQAARDLDLPAGQIGARHVEVFANV
jgi:hypothetical protein